jgi:hypothetical protein
MDIDEQTDARWTDSYRQTHTHTHTHTHTYIYMTSIVTLTDGWIGIQIDK